MRRVCLAAMGLATFGCVGPVRQPETRAPYAVRLLGASDDPLWEPSRGVFRGRAGRDYALEISNRSSSTVGVTIVVDGLDSATGAPAFACSEVGGYVVPARGRIAVRGFRVSETKIATYRLTPREASLAAILKSPRPLAIGKIEACFYSVRPRAEEDSAEGAPRSFVTNVRREDVRIVSDLREEPIAHASEQFDSLIERVVIAYEDEEGRALGTAPPPSGVGYVAPRPPPPPPVRHDDEPEVKGEVKGDVKGTKPIRKRTKPEK